MPRRLGKEGLVVNEKGDFSVESIRSYCSLDPSKGNPGLLSVITVKLLLLGRRELSMLEKQIYITAVNSQYVTLQTSQASDLASSQTS